MKKLNHVCSLLFSILFIINTSTFGALPNPIPICFNEVNLNENLVIYDDEINIHFRENIWGGGSATNVSQAYSGDSALRIDFGQNWSGVELLTSLTAYRLESVGFLQMAILGNMSNQDTRVYLLDNNGQKLGVDLNLFDYAVKGEESTWQVVQIPISDLSVDIGKVIQGIGFQSAFYGTIWVDDIKLLIPEHKGLATFFDDHSHSQLHYWLSYVNIDEDSTFLGKRALKVQIADSWGGLALYSGRPISKYDFGALTLAIKTDNSNIDLSIYAVDNKGRKIGNASIQSKDFLFSGANHENWQVLWIPLQDLIPSNSALYGIGIESETQGTVWVDEVKVREEFKLPLPGGKSWLLTTEVGDKGCNGYIPPLPSHTNVNYSSLDFVGVSAINIYETNVPIYASASGKVVFAGIDENWRGNGTHVIINHDNNTRGQGLETKYLHLREGSVALNRGNHVKQGQYLGILDKSGSGTGSGNWGEHIHLGFYYNNSGSENVSILQSLLMEGLRLDEYVATCSGGNANRYFPSSNTK